MHKRALAGLFVLTLTCAARLAQADAAPPETFDCLQPGGSNPGKGTVGKPCATNGFDDKAPKDGVCTASKCQGNDYTNFADSGKVGTKEYDCNKCIAGSSSSSSGTSGATSNSSGAAPAPPADDGGCNVGERRTLGNVGPWLLALAVPVALFLAKRRKRD